MPEALHIYRIVPSRNIRPRRGHTSKPKPFPNFQISSLHRLKNFTTILLLVTTLHAASQNSRWSMATDLTFQQSVQKAQRYNGLGQNIISHFHASEKDGVYALVAYYSKGSFKNPLTAVAKSASTTPQQINFTDNSTMRLRQISIGWHHYIMGSAYNDENWNVYTTAGFGLIFGNASNSFSATVDTSLYTLPDHPVSGEGNFKRLSFDVGLGGEIPLGGDLFLYIEGRAWLPASSYPSKYLYQNQNAPYIATASVGIRILL